MFLKGVLAIFVFFSDFAFVLDLHLSICDVILYLSMDMSTDTSLSLK